VLVAPATVLLAATVAVELAGTLVFVLVGTVPVGVALGGGVLVAVPVLVAVLVAVPVLVAVLVDVAVLVAVLVAVGVAVSATTSPRTQNAWSGLLYAGKQVVLTPQSLQLPPRYAALSPVCGVFPDQYQLLPPWACTDSQ
jgi:hypothetical protein